MPERRQRAGGVRYDFPIYLSPEDRAHLRIDVGPRGRLLDFAVMQQILIAGEWADVVRYDCHGGFHVHRFTRRGSESRTELGDLSDLDRKYDAAVDDILDNWEENRRRYLDG
jgi:hypothetical protein